MNLSSLNTFPKAALKIGRSKHGCDVIISIMPKHLRVLSLIAAVAVTPSLAHGGSPSQFSEPEVTQRTVDHQKPYRDPYIEDYRCAHELQEALKKGDKAAVARLVEYPFEREKPLRPIESEKQLIENWDDFFDPHTIAGLLNAEAGEIGWRGVELGGGDIWFREGKIYRINVRTEIYKKHFDQVKREDYATLYPSARNYKQLRIECDTGSHHIRIQKHGDDRHGEGIRYFSWKKGAALSGKPELELNGSEKFEGTAGYVLYTFANGKFLYQIDDLGTCMTADCNSHLIVSKDGSELSNQVCK